MFQNFIFLNIALAFSYKSSNVIGIMVDQLIKLFSLHHRNLKSGKKIQVSEGKVHSQMSEVGMLAEMR